MLAVSAAYAQEAAPLTLAPGEMQRAGAVDERFLSYNVEMVEVAGGRFWKPYKDMAGAIEAKRAAQSGPAGLDPALFQYRPPINLANPRLRQLAAALGPAYVRVSGTWANSIYFHDLDAPPPKTPPKGFGGVLTRKQWKGVVDFARAVDARIVTSFAVSAGTRDVAGVWTASQARRFIVYTNSLGGSVAAAEFMNEPNLAALGGAPKGYNAAAYARDMAVFRAFVEKALPGIILLGPGSMGEGGSFPLTFGGALSTEALLSAAGPAVDAFSYHLYAAASKRCAALGPASQVSAADALSRDWFARADAIHDFYAGLRDKFEPGKPLWLTETADAACGGNPWASTFLDTFRYLDRHGRLARKGVQVIAHNTLAAGDYSLLDENTFAPRPNYWAALLWKRLMGTTVLDPGPSPAPDLHLYAHCLRGAPEGVALLAINADQQTPVELQLPVEAERYTLAAKRLEDAEVQLNGVPLQLAAGGGLPPLAGERIKNKRVTLAPATITFLAIPKARNRACR